MVPTEFMLLILALGIAYTVYAIFKTVVHLAVHAAIGIALLFVAKIMFGINVAITTLAIIICAFGGIFGALAVIILTYLKILV